MRTHARLFLIVASVFILSAGTALAVNITIWDKQIPNGPATINSIPNIGLEDNEVENNCIQGQVWDLEAFWQEGNMLTMVGGYNFKQGEGGYKSGDIFLDTDGFATWGSSVGGSVQGGITTVSNSLFNFDYVIHIDDYSTFSTYSVYALSNDSLLTVYYGQNTESNPWRWSAPLTYVPQPIANGNIAFGSFTGSGGYDVAGWGGNDNHYYATGFDLSFLPAGTEFLAKYTYGCGNDNMIGQGKTPPVPEPATLLLMGSGLLGLGFAGFRRKNK